MIHRLALIGFGMVGQGLCRILQDKKSYLKEKYNFQWELVGISDINKGSVFNEKGLDAEKLLSLVKEKGNIEEYPDGEKGWDSLKTIKDSNADIIVEVSYTDIHTGEPAITHCRTAFLHKKHVVTSNKGPAALAYKELSKIAEENNVMFMIEGTVMSGTPVINLALNELAGNNILSAKGILNGTTNYILTSMELGKSYEDALKEAQRLGYAEADPTADVEGYDALAKVLILANVVLGVDLKKEDVYRKGITHISREDIELAKKEKKKWKLLGSITKKENKIEAFVMPEKISLEHPLAGINGTTNAITFTTDLLGDVTIVGPGAGKIQTGYSILTDLLDIHKYKQQFLR